MPEEEEAEGADPPGRTSGRFSVGRHGGAERERLHAPSHGDFCPNLELRKPNFNPWCFGSCKRFSLKFKLNSG